MRPGGGDGRHGGRGGESQNFLRLTDLVYFSCFPTAYRQRGRGEGRGGGGGLVTEFSEAHRPSVLFVFSYVCM